MLVGCLSIYTFFASCSGVAQGPNLYPVIYEWLHMNSDIKIEISVLSKIIISTKFPLSLDLNVILFFLLMLFQLPKEKDKTIVYWKTFLFLFTKV